MPDKDNDKNEYIIEVAKEAFSDIEFTIKDDQTKEIIYENKLEREKVQD